MNIELLHKLHELKSKEKILNDQLDEISKELTALNSEIIQDWANEGTAGHKIEGIGTYFLEERWFASTENKDILFDFLKQSDHKALVYETVNAQRLAAWAKKEIEEKRMTEDQVKMLGANVYKKYTIKIKEKK